MAGGKRWTMGTVRINIAAGNEKRMKVLCAIRAADERDDEWGDLHED